MKSGQRCPPGRRAFLTGAGVSPTALFDRRPLAASQAAPLSSALLHRPVCAGVDLGPSPPGPTGAPPTLTLAWNEAPICTAAVPVAIKLGFLQHHDLDARCVNFGGFTDQLLEGMATGKAGGAIGTALRWRKPLQQGFNLKPGRPRIPGAWIC